MVGNFRGVLIFITFVVDLAVTKIPPMKFNTYMYVYGDIYCALQTSSLGRVRERHQCLYHYII